MTWHRYAVFYDMKRLGYVMAIHENSAFDKGCQLARVSASRYSGRSRNLVHVERCYR